MINFVLRDGNGQHLKGHLHQRNGDTGLKVFTDPLFLWQPRLIPFFNSTYGVNMNQDVSFTGTPDNIHDGGDNAGWTAIANAGTWDFASTTNPVSGSACVELLNANNNDSATFTRSSSIDLSNYETLSLSVRLETWASTDAMLLQFSLGGVDTGISVDITDYLDINVLNEYQVVLIPLGDLNISTATVDEATITITRAGGAKPDFRFDIFQIEESGSPITFKAGPEAGHIFEASSIRLTLADDVTGNAGNSYNKILGLDKLTTGINIVLKINSEILINVTFKCMEDFIATGWDILDKLDDGTNTAHTLDIQFPTPIRMDFRESDTIDVTINDDLSGLLTFKGFLRGKFRHYTNHGREN